MKSQFIASWGFEGSSSTTREKKVNMKKSLMKGYVEGGSLESFSGFEGRVGFLDLFDFSLHEDVVSGGGALFLGGSYK